MRRVVITGMGMVAPTGNSVRENWDRILGPPSAVSTISCFDASSLPVKIAAEVKGFDAVAILGAKEARKASRFVKFAVGAACEAWTDSGLAESTPAADWGCCLGVGLGGFGEIEEGAHRFQAAGPRRVSPMLLPFAIPNMAAGYVSNLLQLKGASFSTATACASGAHAIGEAFLHLRAGMTDVMLAGGVEAATTPLSVSAFARMKALSTRNDEPSKASRPFDRDRDGFVMGEGSAVLVLEEYNHAVKRGATIYAELVGYGMSADAHHITMPHPEGEGAARCISAALRMSGRPVEHVDYINAHGTSTRANDIAESAAIEMVLGEHAPAVPISSTKGATGHCLGAAGAIEAAFSVLATHHGVIPPTLNYETRDPACRLDYTPRQPREQRIRLALSNSFGFGGQNACLAFEHFDGQ